MENIIPYLMALLAFLFINKDRANRTAAALFVMLFSASLFFNQTMDEGPNIFLVELGLIAGFFLVLSAFILRKNMKVTLSIVILCLTDVILASMDIVCYFAYHYKVEWVYVSTLETSGQLAIVQYAALWVNDARRVNLRSYYDNISVYFRNIAMRLFYR